MRRPLPAAPGSSGPDAPAPAGPGPCPEGVEPTQCPDGENGPSGKYTCGDPAMFCSKPCTPGYSGDDIPASEMRMAQPFGQSAAPAGRLVFDKAGNLYFADTSNHLIRMIDGTLYFTDVRNHCVRAIDDKGIITTAVGKCGEKGYDGDDGPADAALLNLPFGVEWADGVLLVADTGNSVIRRVQLQ